MCPVGEQAYRPKTNQTRGCGRSFVRIECSNPVGVRGYLSLVSAVCCQVVVSLRQADPSSMEAVPSVCLY